MIGTWHAGKEDGSKAHQFGPDGFGGYADVDGRQRYLAAEFSRTVDKGTVSAAVVLKVRQ